MITRRVSNGQRSPEGFFCQRWKRTKWTKWTKCGDFRLGFLYRRNTILCGPAVCCRQWPQCHLVWMHLGTWQLRQVIRFNAVDSKQAKVAMFLQPTKVTENQEFGVEILSGRKQGWSQGIQRRGHGHHRDTDHHWQMTNKKYPCEPSWTLWIAVFVNFVAFNYEAGVLDRTRMKYRVYSATIWQSFQWWSHSQGYWIGLLMYWMYWSLIGSMLCGTAVWGPAGLGKMQEAGMEGRSIHIQINTINTINQYSLISFHIYRQTISDLYSHLDQFVLQISDLTARWYSSYTNESTNNASLHHENRSNEWSSRRGWSSTRLTRPAALLWWNIKIKKGRFAICNKNRRALIHLLQTRIEVKASNVVLILAKKVVFKMYMCHNNVEKLIFVVYIHTNLH